jgi:RNA polymerase sigma-70 factor (ECF subfamily)
MARKTLSANDMDSPDEFESVYKANAPLIYRFMFWRTKDEMLAEDLTSNVFTKAWTKRLSFSGGSVKAWIFKIASTTLIDYWRKKKDLPANEEVIAEIVSDNAALDEALDSQLSVVRLRAAVVKLPSEMQSVVKLRFIERLSVRKVAGRLNLSEANVRVIQYRALRKLRGHLK